MTTYQWLLVFHVTGAFLLLGGGAIAAALNLSALGRERPSEIVLLFGLIRIAVVVISVGTLLAFVFGLWLVHEARLRLHRRLGDRRDRAADRRQRDGRRGRQARPGDGQAGRASSPRRATRRARSCKARVHDPISLALSYGSGLVLDRRARPDDLEAGRVMLALIRPDSWNLPLFLHVLGATVLFGTVATVAIAGFASRGARRATRELLARVAAATFLLG